MISAQDLSARLAELLRREHSAMADFLIALAEFDRQRVWVELGHASLFSYLRRDLHLSAGAAQYRKTAAELVQRYPQVEAALRDGRLCLSSVIALGKVITPENAEELLPRFFGLSARDAEVLAVTIRPVEDPPLREVVTVVRSPVPALVPALDLTPAPSLALQAALGTDPASGAAPVFRTSEMEVRVAPSAETVAPARVDPLGVRASARRPVDVEPLTEVLSRLHVTVSRRLLQKLDAARDALSHSLPNATADEIIEAGIDLLLERAAKRRGLVEKPRAPRATLTAPSTPTSVATATPTATRTPTPTETATPIPTATPTSVATAPSTASPISPSIKNAPSKVTATTLSPSTASPDYIPAAVRRAVWIRDRGRCTFPLASGDVCGRTDRLEYDHATPTALGGESTVENVRLRCRWHNVVEARRVLGDAVMDRYTAAGRAGFGRGRALVGASA